MDIGVVFPLEVGHDQAVIREIAQGAEGLGFDHIMLEEHVLGADPTTGSYREDGWHWGPAGRPGVTKDAAIHEPFVLLGLLAAFTTRIGLGTAVLILPQRQTAIVAKQATEVDLLSGGRLRLGVGAGWNPVEFEGLGMDFDSRGQREEEQIDLLRQLWAHETLDFKGQWHRIDHAGINPRPGRQIPIWLGGAREVALKRAARIADGYMPLGVAADDAGKALIERLRGLVRAAGRDAKSFGIEAFELTRGRTPDDWSRNYETWQSLGVSHLTLRIGNPEFESPRRYIDVMQAYRKAIGK